MSKFLFVDFDGVLNSRSLFLNPPKAVRRMGNASGETDLVHIDATGAKIVVSSTWRHGRSIAALQDLLYRHGLRRFQVIGKTPDLRGRERGYEIDAWLQANAPDATFVILFRFRRSRTSEPYVHCTECGDSPAHARTCSVTLAAAARHR
jgi:hypothetical protein